MRNKKISAIILFSILLFSLTSLFYTTNARKEYTVTTTWDPIGAGKISPLDDTGVNKDILAFSIIPNGGYYVAEVTLDGEKIDISEADPLAPVTCYVPISAKEGNRSLHAEFAEYASVTDSEGNPIEANIAVISASTLQQEYPAIANALLDYEGNYIEIVAENTINGLITVNVHYEDTGDDAWELENMKLYIGNPVDFNGDGSVNGNDISIIQEAIKNNDLAYDVNGDTVVDNIDLAIVKEYANDGLIVNPGQNNAGEFRIPWIDITTNVDAGNNIITGVTWHLSLFRAR